MTPTLKRARVPRHAKRMTTKALLRDLDYGTREKFNWLPGFGKHRANTQEAK